MLLIHLYGVSIIIGVTLLVLNIPEATMLACILCTFFFTTRRHELYTIRLESLFMNRSAALGCSISISDAQDLFVLAVSIALLITVFLHVSVIARCFGSLQFYG
jgi:hypothetical protein